jgi:hypothetical protein
MDEGNEEPAGNPFAVLAPPKKLTKKKKKLLKRKLPNKLIIINNPDKKFHEKWYPRRNPLNIPHPFRCLAIGPPNSGKTLVIKNILLRARPKFKQVIVIHCDGGTSEYKDVGATMLSEIPDADDWGHDGIKKLVIVDDLELKNMDKTQKRNLDRLFGYVSTHCNVSVILTSQDGFNVFPAVRRCSNVQIMWRTPDLDSLGCLSRKVGLNSKDLKILFDRHMKSKHDSLWLDQTNNSPYPLRLNGFEMISRPNAD